MRPHGWWLVPYLVVLGCLPLLMLIPPSLRYLGHSWLYAACVGLWAWGWIRVGHRWIGEDVHREIYGDEER